MISGSYSDHKITALCLISMFPIVTILYSEASEYIFLPFSIQINIFYRRCILQATDSSQKRESHPWRRTRFPFLDVEVARATLS